MRQKQGEHNTKCKNQKKGKLKEKSNMKDKQAQS